MKIQISRYTIFKGALAIMVLASALSAAVNVTNPDNEQQDYQQRLCDTARKQVDVLTRDLTGAIPLVTDKLWHSIYAVDVGAFCDNRASWSPVHSFTVAFSARGLPTLAGDFEIADARSISNPFPGVALLLRSRNNQDILDRRPYGVWWLLQLSQDDGGALRQSIVDSKLLAPIHFGPERPLVPLAWKAADGFTLFAAVTPMNCILGEKFAQLLDENRAESPSSFAGSPLERYQAALEYWRRHTETKQHQWNEQEHALRAKLEMAKDKPQSEAEAVRNEVSDAAAKAKAAKDAYIQAHPQPTPFSSL